MAEKRGGHESPMYALALIVVTVGLMIAVGVRAIDLHFFVGPWFLHHWITWAGSFFIAIFTPVFYVLKRQRGRNINPLLLVHVFGGLLSALLISLHFTQHVTRPAEFYPDLGTGVVLYAALVFSAVTGIFMRYRIASGGMREWRLIHVGAAGAFYIAIVMHVLTGLNIL